MCYAKNGFKFKNSQIQNGFKLNKLVDSVKQNLAQISDEIKNSGTFTTSHRRKNT